MAYIEDAVLLDMLKMNQEILTDYMDPEAVAAKNRELGWYIGQAKEYIQREGITLVDTIGDAGLVTMYAGWLYGRRKAADPAAGMPRMLRWNLNNRLFQEHVSGTPATGDTCPEADG